MSNILTFGICSAKKVPRMLLNVFTVTKTTSPMPLIITVADSFLTSVFKVFAGNVGKVATTLLADNTVPLILG